MDEKQTSGGSVVAAIVLGLVLLLIGYVGGYFGLSTRTFGHMMAGPDEYRTFEYNWMAMLFSPAAKVESVIRSKEIQTSHQLPRKAGRK
jgi:hypothetical protein